MGMLKDIFDPCADKPSFKDFIPAGASYQKVSAMFRNTKFKHIRHFTWPSKDSGFYGWWKNEETGKYIFIMTVSSPFTSGTVLIRAAKSETDQSGVNNYAKTRQELLRLSKILTK